MQRLSDDDQFVLRRSIEIVVQEYQNLRRAQPVNLADHPIFKILNLIVWALLMVILVILCLVPFEIHYRSKLSDRHEKAISTFGQTFDPYLKPEQVLWFGRKMPAENPWEQIKNEWLKNGFLEDIDIEKLWIPLNSIDSLKLENHWRQNFVVCQTQSPFFYNPIVLMNGLYSLFETHEHFYVLKPIYWNNKNDIWIVIRCECGYEIPKPPPPMYYSQIHPNLNNKFLFYQPLPCDFGRSDNLEMHHINNIITENQQQSVYEHVIFVIHGIGHHEGEENIVQNANDILNGFISYNKKFYPDLKIPLIIPIAWRHNLLLSDETIQAIRLMKGEKVKNLGLILNDVLYYTSPYYQEKMKNSLIRQLKNKYALFMKNNPQFNGTISILAHSLGTVITFDVLNDNYETLGFEVKYLFFLGSPLSLFLANRGITGEKLRQNPCIINGTLFNIIHSNDPVAHRLEPLFHSEYNATEPHPLWLDRYFRNTFFKSIYSVESEEYEINEISYFQHRLINDSKIIKEHDSFIISVYSNYTFEKNAIISEELLNVFYFYHLPNKNTTTYVKTIPKEHRLTYRIDYNLYKSVYHYNIDVDYFNNEAAIWAYELFFVHISYWNRPEIVVFMSTILYSTTPLTKYPEGPYFYVGDIFLTFTKKFHEINIFLIIFLIFTAKYIYFYRDSFFSLYWQSDKTNYSYLYCLYSIFLIICEFLAFLIFAFMACTTPLLLVRLLPHYVEHVYQPLHVKIYMYVIIYLIIIPISFNIFFSFHFYPWIKNFVIIIQLFWIPLYGYTYLVEFHRSYDLKCRNSVEDGLCRDYQLFNSSLQSFLTS